MIVELQEEKLKESRLISTTIDTSGKLRIVNGFRLKLIRLRIKLTLLKVIVNQSIKDLILQLNIGEHRSN